MIDAGAVASRCLTAIVDHHQREGWVLPARRFVGGGSPNEVAADDEHLAVILDGINPGYTEGSARTGGVQSKAAAAVLIPRATFVVRLMRCVPTGDEHGPPDPDVIHVAGLELLTDVGRVLASLHAWRAVETGPGANGPVSIGQVESIGPGGGLAGHLFFTTIAPVQ